MITMARAVAAEVGVAMAKGGEAVVEDEGEGIITEAVVAEVAAMIRSRSRKESRAGLAGVYVAAFDENPQSRSPKYWRALGRLLNLLTYSPSSFFDTTGTGELPAVWNSLFRAII
jgi:hypothetical protein